MNRREFITLLGGAAAAWPLAARAQQPAMPVIGFLRSVSLTDATPLVTAFRHGLKETGFVEGRSVAIEFRTAEGHNDRLPALVSELIRRPVTAIFCNTAAAQVAKAATTSIPIIFTTGSDPVRDGLVASLNRPGGNLTGASFFSGALGGKRLELLRQLLPKATAIALLVNPATPESEGERREVVSAAQSLGQELIVFDVSNDGDIEAAFATFSQRGVGAVLIGAGGFMFPRRERLVALAAHYRLPASYSSREAALAGGLMSYAGSQRDAYHQAGIYTGRILKGEKPADLPFLQSTRFELVLNLKTAKDLGLDVPDKLLALADEVIE
jgi:putative tryptophan/tyrosine transport system substrate-binding protein